MECLFVCDNKSQYFHFQGKNSPVPDDLQAEVDSHDASQQEKIVEPLNKTGRARINGNPLALIVKWVILKEIRFVSIICQLDLERKCFHM